MSTESKNKPTWLGIAVGTAGALTLSYVGRAVFGPIWTDVMLALLIVVYAILLVAWFRR